MNISTSSIQGSPGPGRTRKIFVRGLASTVTESDFKKYFDQFGNITNDVVMYDHNTQRPRGFGFITYDSEEAVEKKVVKKKPWTGRRNPSSSVGLGMVKVTQKWVMTPVNGWRHWGG
ncbi:hypothetical protein V6N13_092858 [Hibiscus sabdariffa]|uniref:Uncharacterized protein n=2 Tax=Hibiscus sabdariffa TaxID=183260 RepID=A0ABR2AQS0_9ROSI